MKAFYKFWVIGLLCFPVLTSSQEIEADLWKMMDKPHESVDFMEFTPDGQYLITASNANEDKSIKLWDVSTGELAKILVEDDYWKLALDISPDGKYLAYGNWKAEIKLISLETGRLVRTFRGHSFDVRDIVFSPNGKYLVSGCAYRYKDKGYTGIRVWSVMDGALVRQFDGFCGGLGSMQFSPDGKLLLHTTVYENTGGRILYPEYLIDFPTNKLIRKYNLENQYKWLHNSKFVELAYTRYINDIKTGLREQKGGNIRSDDKYFATMTPDNSTSVWRTKLSDNVYDLIFESEETNEMVGQLGGVDVNYSISHKVTFSHDGKYLATVGTKKEAFFDKNLKPQTRSFQAIAIWKMEGIKAAKPVEIADYTLTPTPLA